MRHVLRVLLLLALGVAGTGALGQTVHGRSERPRVAVVLSGGGSRGLAHIGVLKVLEEAGLKPDLITGTSMGAVVGGLYATGFTADELADLALRTNWNELLSDEPARPLLSMEEKLRDGRFIASLPLRGIRVRLPSGLLAGQRVSEVLARLTWPVHHVTDFSLLPIPFACLATDIVTGEPVLLERGYLPEALRASMAIPSAFTPVELEGRVLVDGGVVRNLPAVDARELGADVVICSDVSRPLLERDRLDSIISIMEQTFNFEYWASVSEQRRHCDLVIVPELEKRQTLDFSHVEAVIRSGKDAADTVKDRLVALADSVSRPEDPPAVWNPAAVDSVLIVDYELIGLTRVPPLLVIGLMDLEIPSWVSAADIERDIERIFATRFFERVTYRIDLAPEGYGSVLRIRSLERRDNEVRFGFRFDLRNQSRLVVATAFQNVLSKGSKLVLETEIGNRLSLATDYYLKMGLQGRQAIRLRGELFQQRIDEFADGKAQAQIDTRSASFEAGVASVYSTRGYYGVSVIAMASRTAPRIARTDEFPTSTSTLILPTATIWLDTFDRIAFPRRGGVFYLSSIGTHEALGSGISMSQHRFIRRYAHSLSKRITLITDFEAAATFGNRQELPGQLRIGLGGLIKGPFETGRFVGLGHNERTGRFLTKAGLHLQMEFQSRRYLTLIGNVGSASEEWSQYPYGRDDVLLGVGAALGLETAIGPFEVTVGVGNRDKARVTFNVGYLF